MQDTNEKLRLTAGSRQRIATNHVRVPSPMIGQYTLDLRVNSIRDTGTVPVAVWTRGFNLTGRERFAAGRFLARVDANRTLAPGTLESGSRPEQVWTRPSGSVF